MPVMCLSPLVERRPAPTRGEGSLRFRLPTLFLQPPFSLPFSIQTFSGSTTKLTPTEVQISVRGCPSQSHLHCRKRYGHFTQMGSVSGISSWEFWRPPPRPGTWSSSTPVFCSIAPDRPPSQNATYPSSCVTHLPSLGVHLENSLPEKQLWMKFKGLAFII